MTIVWINHYAVPESGSAGTRHATLGRYLEFLGHRVLIVASALPDGRRPTVCLAEKQNFIDKQEGPVMFRYVRTRAYSSAPGRLLSMLEFRKRVLACPWNGIRPDVVIGSSVHLHAADAGRLLAKMLGVPFVFEIRDPWPEGLADFGALPRFHPVYFYLGFIERTCINEASGVITLLPNYFDYLESRGKSRDKVLYLPNGIEVSLFPESPQPPLKDEFIVSYFGAHGPVNGLETILWAAKKVAERGLQVRFRLVGDGSQKEKLVALAESLRLRNVEFLDPVPKTELSKLAQNSHAFVFHLRDIGTLRRYGISSNKLFDYMLAGRPIIFACNSANNPVEEAKAGISVPPEDASALSEGVEMLLRLGEKEREAMGKRGRAWVIEHHDIKKLATRLSVWLEELLEKEKGRKDGV